MVTDGFPRLVAAVVEGLGQSPREVKELPRAATYLATPDGFLYVFLEDPSFAREVLAPGGGLPGHRRPRRLVVFSPLALPAALTRELESRGATVVAGEPFQQLLESLDLSRSSGDRPSEVVGGTSRRVLPSAQLLDATMDRARRWMEWGIPALALRFYQRAARLKPGYLPARRGIGQSLLALGLAREAEGVFDQILREKPDDWEGQLGKARSLGLRGDNAAEIEALRRVIQEHPERWPLRVHYLVALIEVQRWAEANGQVEALLEKAPEEPYFHALASVCLANLGRLPESRQHEEQALSLGMDPEALKDLKMRLGVSPPRGKKG
jgi:tetratricopeptide (TPR) repeat protein